MKNKLTKIFATVAGVGLFLVSGCDWSTNGGSLNTSQGAGININFSGVYNGNISGRAVDRTSAGTIASLTIRQTGNRVEVVDSQGSRYEGAVGSPGIVSQAGSAGRFPAGAELVQAQISWAGKDGVAQRDVEFVGIIHAVSVEDVKGTSTITKQESSNSREKSDNYSYTKTVQITTNAILGQTITETEVAYDADGNVVYKKETTTTVPPYGGDVTKTERVILDKRKSSSGSSTTTTTETTFKLTEANVQYRLEGTWIEKNSPIVSRVDAISRGTFGIITISQTGAQEGGIGGGGGTSGGTSGGTTQ